MSSILLLFVLLGAVNFLKEQITLKKNHFSSPESLSPRQMKEGQTRRATQLQSLGTITWYLLFLSVHLLSLSLSLSLSPSISLLLSLSAAMSAKLT